MQLEVDLKEAKTLKLCGNGFYVSYVQFSDCSILSACSIFTSMFEVCIHSWLQVRVEICNMQMHVSDFLGIDRFSPELINASGPRTYCTGSCDSVHMYVHVFPPENPAIQDRLFQRKHFRVLLENPLKQQKSLVERLN